MTHSEITNFLWKIADLLRGPIKRGKYADVILPLTVLRRIDCVLSPTKSDTLARFNRLKASLSPEQMGLEAITGVPFYNTSKYDFEKLKEDAGNLRMNLQAYMDAFSPNMRDIVERLDFRATLAKLEQEKLLYKVFERFLDVDLSPDKVDNHSMGTIFEELIRKFNEMVDENAGEHFTPREVVELMVRLIIEPDHERISRPSAVCKVYDPACGTGGMLSTAKDLIEKLNGTANVALYGQEVNDETWAICKSDMLIKSDHRDELLPQIARGSTLSADAFAEEKFDYMICNPPYGHDWKKDEDEVRYEHSRGTAGAYSAGLPTISDGQLLFLQKMIFKMEPVNGDYSRIAIIMNGSPLFTGDAGSGPSEIRRWILENDWLEALIALPEQMFYNTGISTYIWVLTNKKPEPRVGKVQLVDARNVWTPGGSAENRKSLGDKRRHISAAGLADIYALYEAFKESETSKIFATTDFGYRKITVERPLKLNFQITPERIERLWEQSGFKNLDKSQKRKDEAAIEEDIRRGSKEQQAILDFLLHLSASDSSRGAGDGGRVEAQPATFLNREEFRAHLKAEIKKAGVPLSAAVEKSLLAALGERDEDADICLDKDGHPEADPDLRDTENVPLSESVHEFFDREVLPHVPDAWINESVRDHKDGQIGKVGYEINFNRYFYKYTPPRPLEEIDADIQALEQEILDLLSEVSR